MSRNSQWTRSLCVIYFCIPDGIYVIWILSENNPFNNLEQAIVTYLYRLTNVEMTWLKKIWNMRMYFFFSLYVAICFPLIPLPVKQKIYLFVPSSSYVKNPQLPPLVWPRTRKVIICAVQLKFTSRLLYSWY